MESDYNRINPIKNSLQNIYLQGIEGNDLLKKLRDEWKVRDGWYISAFEHIALVKKQQIDLTQIYADTIEKNTLFDKELYDRQIQERNHEIDRIEQSVKSDLKKLLMDGELVGLGYRSIDDLGPCIIPKHEWSFLTIDPDNNQALCSERSYRGVRFFVKTELEAQPEKMATIEIGGMKKEKRLIPHIRDRSELTELLYKMFKAYGVKIGALQSTSMKPEEAWRFLMTRQFKDDLIKTVHNAEKKTERIELDGHVVYFQDFKTKYNGRFK